MFELVPPWALWVFVACWGAIWGSFANVVIARVPRGASVVFPASHCTNCETPIRWFDNLPILSWLWLRGACRACGAKISVRYLVVEVLGVAASLALFWHAAGGYALWRWEGSPLDVLLVWMLLTYLVIGFLCLSAIDLEHALLPHSLTIGLAVLGLIYALLAPSTGDFRGFVPSQDVFGALLGFAVGYGSLFIFALAYRLIRGRYGIGGGDFLLFGVLGAWFGWESLPILMMAAAIQGVLAAALAPWLFPSLVQDASSDEFWESSGVGETSPPAPMEEEGAAPSYGVPFGPFLCLAAVEYIFIGGHYLRWLWGA